MSRNTIFLVFLILVVAVFSYLNFFLFKDIDKGKVVINGKTIYVEIAKTPTQLAQGLSGRDKLPADHGMLFIFNKTGKYLFWMKDMKFSLDFVDINGNTVVDIVENVPYPQPGKLPRGIQPQKDFDKVLEINAGEVKKLGIKVGQTVGF